MMYPCLNCGVMVDGASRCEKCRLFTRGLDRRSRPDSRSSAARGYGWAWQQLSRRARAMQPFCSRCGSTTDLQADHTPRAWKRHAEGLPVRLKDIDVLCEPCNQAAGDARPGSARYERWERSARRARARRAAGRAPGRASRRSQGGE